MPDIFLLKQEGTTFSKKQEQFNRLILSLERKKKLLILLETRFRDYIVKFRIELEKPMKDFTDSMLAFAQLLDRHYESGELKPSEQEKTIQYILTICKNIEGPEKIEDHQKLLIKYLSLDHKKMNKRQKSLLKEVSKELFSAAFDTDEEEENDDTVQLKYAADEQKDPSPDRKQKKYPGINNKMAEKAALLQKSWKTLYLKLVKRFHPDTENNEERRIYKTGILQQVTMAYEKKDFYTLLAIYQQQSGFDNEESQKEDQLFADHALYQYILLLKQQEAELKIKITDIEFEAAIHGMPYIADKNAEKYLYNNIKTQKFIFRSNLLTIKADTARSRNIHQYKMHLKSVRFESDFD